MTGMLTFFLFNNSGIMYAKRVVIDLFSGLLLPISFIRYGPKSNDVLPFQAISYIPSMIFSEGIQGSKLYEALVFQVIWAIVLIIPIVLMWRTARKRLIVQGDDEMLYINLFLQYASQYIKTKLEYRGDFIVGLLSDLSLQAVNLIFILVVFGHTQALKGWSREEVIFIYGFF